MRYAPKSLHIENNGGISFNFYAFKLSWSLCDKLIIYIGKTGYLDFTPS